MKTKKIMVITVLLMLLIISGCTNGSDDAVDADDDWDFYNKRAEAFIKANARSDFGAVHGMLDETMGGMVDEAGLRTIWEEIIAVAGEFIAIHGIENAVSDELYISGVTMRHENFGFGWNIIFSEDGFVAGFRTGGTILLPPETENAQTERTVAQRDGFTDYPVVIGAGTDYPLNAVLSMPDDATGKVPAVVIVHGSGPHDMDGNLYGNTPYRDIAEFLASNGIAAIRHDKRNLTHGAKIMQEIGGSQTVWEESIEDAILAAEILRANPRIDENRVYIIGHSLGGTIAPRIHANGGNFAGLILMAASPRAMFSELIIELNIVSITLGYEHDVIDAETKDAMLADIYALAELLKTVADMPDDEAKALMIPAAGSFAYYIKDLEAHTFADYAKNVTVPILAIQGGRDFQILPDVDFIILQEILAGRDNVTFKLYEDLNHLFVATTATNFNEHAMQIIENPGRVHIPALQDIVDWINKQ